MKQIINGKMYNTETAKLIASDSSSGIGCGDFNYWEEDLCQTKKGTFFIAGSGGANTCYRMSTGNNSSSGGNNITVVTELEAMRWLEKHGSAEEYAAAFTVEEG